MNKPENTPSKTPISPLPAQPIKEPENKQKPKEIVNNITSTSSSEASSWKPALDSLIKTIEPNTEADTIPLHLWKTNIQSNAGQPIIKRYENLWTMCHENNIDLGRLGEVWNQTIQFSH